MSLKIKLFTMRLNPSLGEFDDTDTTHFLADKDLIEAVKTKTRHPEPIELRISR